MGSEGEQVPGDQDWVALRDTIVTQLGELPAPVPLDAKVLDEQGIVGGKRLLVEYAVEAGERIEAYLLVPDRLTTQVPGILAVHQDGPPEHLRLGKAEPAGVAGDREMGYGIELMQRGYVVLCPDRPVRGARLADSAELEQFWPAFEDERVRILIEGEWHDVQLLMAGRTRSGKEISDLMRAVDYLGSLGEVDERRIGSIGHSAGGLMTAFLILMDERVKVGYSSCGVGLTADRLAPRAPKGLAMAAIAVPGMLGAWDMDDVLALIAPRPFMQSEGDADHINGDREAAARARERVTAKATARYAELGVPDRFRVETFRGGHEFPRDVRRLAYEWMDAWLEPESSTGR